jgi:hypothetical protein
MREFRDARKAMEKEANDRDAGPGAAKRRKNGKEKEKGLLKAAILNNAARGKEGSSAPCS